MIWMDSRFCVVHPRPAVFKPNVSVSWSTTSPVLASLGNGFSTAHGSAMPATGGPGSVAFGAASADVAKRVPRPTAKAVVVAINHLRNPVSYPSCQTNNLRISQDLREVKTTVHRRHPERVSGEKVIHS